MSILNSNLTELTVYLFAKSSQYKMKREHLG